MSIKQYYLGCPFLEKKSWIGNFYKPNTGVKDYLGQYSSIFNTVEGNNTFYSLPNKETILKWKEIIPDEFKFCFKFPYSVTNVRQLNNVETLTEEFLNLLKPLQKHIGLLFLQLPHYFTSNHLEKLDTYLSILPKHFEYTVEVRHVSFYTDSVIERELNDLLEKHRASRAIFDTYLLHSQQSENKTVIKAQQKNPKLPDYFKAIGKKPLMRFIGHNDVEQNNFRLEKITRTISNWIKDGRTPYVFMHTPDYKNAPSLCLKFHNMLKTLLPETNIGTVPIFPAEKEARISAQLSLF